MKNIVILGSTGSIGTQTLDVIREFPLDFRVVGLTANTNIELLEKQIEEFSPEIIAVGNQENAQKLYEKTHRKILVGEEGLCNVAGYKKAELVINALSGPIGLIPTIDAIVSKKPVALANKESLVSAGEILMSAAYKNKTPIIPIDSELSALFQIISFLPPDKCICCEISRIILTCSGGPFRGKKRPDLKNVTLDQALKHPTWKMGKKISIDSATLMNKGFELIAASRLFGLPENKIEVVLHKESIVHAIVEWNDGQTFACMTPTSMRYPILTALYFPKRKANNWQRIDFTKQKLTFEKIDEETFPTIKIAREALQRGGTAPALLNIVNDIAVRKFLNSEIKFLDIIDILKNPTTLDLAKKPPYTAEDILNMEDTIYKHFSS